MMATLNENYWEQRYRQAETAWDIGNISEPLKNYFDQLTDKQIRILIPGCGNAYEAQYLFEQGFTNVHLLDWSASALQNFKERVPSFPSEQLLQQDFFTYKPSTAAEHYDLIVEQTFFCALQPELRIDYVRKMHELLRDGGKLVGLLFRRKFEERQGPPFGGDIEDYQPLFAPYFTFKTFELCYNSIAPRAGSELFINLVRRDNS